MCLSAAAAGQPNVLLIIADDLGCGDLGFYGNKTLKTPHLDRLAAEGIRFTDFYAAGLQCTPSRAGLLTGRYPVRFGLTFTLMKDAGGGLPANEITLAQVMRDAGYATALIGKWHLGDGLPFRPSQRGFDLFEGLLCGNDLDADRYFRGGESHDNVPAAQFTAGFTRAAIDFIGSAREAKRPFFLMLAPTAVHAPHTPGEGFAGRSRTGPYGDCVEELDDAVGQLLKVLSDHQLDENTIVFFTSDNGPPMKEGIDAPSTGGLRGGKFTVYEGGIRVPMVARWKGTWKPRVERTPAILLDLFPTLANLCGARLPARRKLDGADLSALLRDTKPIAERPLYFFFPEKLRAVRQGRWKLMLPGEELKRWQLFDLEKDRGEATNLANEQPTVVEELRRSIELAPG